MWYPGSGLVVLDSGMRKFRIDQDFLIEHWHMIYVMPFVFAQICFRMKLNSIKHKLDGFY